MDKQPWPVCKGQPRTEITPWQSIDFFVCLVCWFLSDLLINWAILRTGSKTDVRQFYKLPHRDRVGRSWLLSQSVTLYSHTDPASIKESNSATKLEIEKIWSRVPERSMSAPDLSPVQVPNNSHLSWYTVIIFGFKLRIFFSLFFNMYNFIPFSTFVSNRAVQDLLN